MPEAIKQFVDTLHESKRNAAYSKYRELQQEYKSAIENELQRDKNSMNFVDLAIYPFGLSGKLAQSKYRFYCADPLFYLAYQIKDTASFDILLYNEEDASTIFIECKSGLNISDTILGDINKKISTVKKYFKTEFDVESSNTEFVLMTTFETAEKLPPLSNDIIIWAADYWKGLIKIKIGTHKNVVLNSLLSQGIAAPEFNKIINIMPSSHFGNILSIVTSFLDLSMVKRETERFTIVDINEILFKEFRNYPETGIKKISEGILSCGIECGVFSKFGDNEYGIAIGTKNGGAARNASRRYIDYFGDKKALSRLKEIFSAQNRTLV